MPYCNTSQTHIIQSSNNNNNKFNSELAKNNANISDIYSSNLTNKELMKNNTSNDWIYFAPSSNNNLNADFKSLNQDSMLLK